MTAMNQTTVVVVAAIKVKSGVEERARQVLLEVVAPTRLEPGCLNYDLHQSATDPTEFLFHETWTSDEALAAHSTSTSPHRQALREQLGELLAGPPQVTRWRPVVT